IGGLAGIADPGAEVIASSDYAAELRIVNSLPVPYTSLLGRGAATTYQLSPSSVVSQRQRRVIGGVEFELVPAPDNGHSKDALTIYLPSQKVLFAGDLMVDVGVPWLPEGSADGLLRSLDVLMSFGDVHV